ncbi:hypothetical protein GOBAR_DD07798 [Gossypium barbadense]|nr:hypothetical protein GOBAR_DD07798 [Gossypium barbadense]
MRLLVGSGYAVKSSCWQWLHGQDRKLVMLSREKRRHEKCSQVGEVQAKCHTPRATKDEYRRVPDRPDSKKPKMNTMGFLIDLIQAEVD